MIDCKDCDKKFRNKQALRIHQNKRHGKEDEFECSYCENEYEKYLSLVRHSGRYCEGDSPEQLYADFCFDGEWSTCQCGCGEKVNLQRGSDKGYKFAKYKQGHYARDNGGFWTEEGLKKSAETRRKQFESGEREPWNKGMTLEENPDNEGLQKLQEKSREHLIERMASSEFEPISELENEFGEILDTLDIEYSYQEPLEGFVYDFWLPQTDTYIEVHGDFWHCNPDAGYEKPQYPVQERTVENDKKKEKVIKENDKDLLVFWETDINENRKEVIQKLLQHA